MTVIASLITSLGLESSSFTSGIASARREMKETQRQFQSIGVGMATAGAAISLALTAPVTALVSAAIPAAVESRQALAQVNAALASMGPVAGHTSEQLQQLASDLQDTSNFDDDDILKSVTANLLTFGKVSGEAFDRAQQAAVNLSARLGQDLQSSAIQVGKALNDPVKGVTALQRVGVSFTAAQKDQIAAMVAAGDAAGAQSLILGELERQFGGAAKAQREATPTAAQDQAWRTFQENVGGLALTVLPALTQVATAVLTGFNEMPAGMQTVVVAIVALTAALGPVLIGAGALAGALGAAIPVIVTLSGAIVGTAIPAIASFIVAMAPVLLPLAALAGAISLVVAAIRHWDEIEAITAGVVGWIGRMVTGVQDWLVGKLVRILRSIAAPIQQVGDWFFQLYDRVVGHSYIPDMVDGIGDEMRRLDAEMVHPAKAATDAAAQAFQALAQRVAPILDRLFPDQAKINAFKRDLADLETFAAASGWSPEQTSEARRRLLVSASGGDPAAERQGITDPDPRSAIPPGEVERAAADTAMALDGLSDKSRTATAAVVENFAGMTRDVVTGLGSIGRSIKSGDWLGTLQSVVDLIGQVAGFLRGGQPATRVFAVDGLAGARADGGPVMPHSTYLVGERGPELLRLGSQGGRVVPNHEMGSGGASVSFDLRGAVMTEDLLAQMQGMADGAAMRGSMGGAQLAREQASRASKRRLGR